MEPSRRQSPIALIVIVVLLAAVVGGLIVRQRREPTPQPVTIPLAAGWSIASTAGVAATGADVSAPGFATAAWTPAQVPTTVLAALVADGEYPNLYEGTNVERVPAARFAVPWWYRTEFILGHDPGAHTWLHLDGINYRAEVWLNGQMIAGSDTIVGTYRAFDLDVTDAVRTGVNALGIRVDPVNTRRDLTITWIDWNPLAPDAGMGIWQPAWISRTGPVTIADPQVMSSLPLPETSSADLTISATVHNAADQEIRTDVRATFGDVEVHRSVDLPAGATSTVRFEPSADPTLHLTDPPLWWPYRDGAQPIEHLTATASVNGAVSDTATTDFGIREVTSRMTAQHHRQFLVNGVPVLIRGGGWAPDMLLRPDPERTDQQLLLARHLGLNAVRLEGKLETDHFFDEADRLGILVLPGWMCCDHWQNNEDWTAEDYAVARGSMTSQAVRLRNHPSVLAFLIGSDTSPPQEIASMYAGALRAADWPDPVLASASQDGSPATGPTGVKMTGPYDWVPPGYWYDPRGPGAAFGFNTETSAGASIPELESLRRFMTPDELRALWSEPTTPQSHAGTGNSRFKTLRLFDAAMDARLGKPSSLAAYVEEAQVLQYENERAMFEAFSRNRPTSTGLIQWMLNNAWPSLHWNLFDWYLKPNGSTFGAQEANRPVHVLYGYDDASISVTNDTMHSAAGLRVRADMFDLTGRRVWSRTGSVSVPADGVRTAFRVPATAPHPDVWFLRLRLVDISGRAVDTNTYWLARRMDTSAFAKSQWYVTPTATYADMTPLGGLARAEPSVSACIGGGAGRVTVTNDTGRIVFFLRLRLTTADDEDVTPVLWSDGDLTLMPGERRTVTVRAGPSAVEGAVVLVISGWNTPASSQALRSCA